MIQELELTDRTLVALMASIILRGVDGVDGSEEFAVEKAKEILRIVETGKHD